MDICQNIIIGFSRAKSPWKIGSKIIAEVEKRDFSHAYIRYICPTTKVQIVAQASHGYVNEMNYDIFLQHNIVVEEYELSCTDQEFTDILIFIKQNLGIEYSKMQILFIAIKKLLHFEINIYNRDKEFICSEFAARICQMAKVTLPTYLDYFTPSNLNTLVKDIKLTRIVYNGNFHL